MPKARPNTAPHPLKPGRIRTVLTTLGREIAQDLIPVGSALPPEPNVQIDLPFVPERFHVLAFQQYGRVTGTDDRSIELRGVKRTDLNAVARPYWVTAVGPIKQGG